MEKADSIIQELMVDYVHGASWYYDKAVEFFESLGSYDPNKAEILEEVRPGMASVKNVIEAFKKGTDEGYSIEKIAKVLRFLKNSAYEKISKSSLEISSAATISFSSNVLSLLKSSGVKQIYVFTSDPNIELKQALDEYSKFAVTTAVPLSSAQHYIEYVEAVVSGFDGLYSSGHFVNKSGTFMLFCTAKEKGIKNVIVGESFKAYDGFPPPPLKVKWENLLIPIFESVPLKLVDMLITDSGSYSNPDSLTVKEIYKNFVEEFEKKLREGDL
ncbi:MAG: hypothetical protein ACP5SE_05125 [Nitrososphaeria archaeon]